MTPNSPENTTRRIGKSQGYIGLSVADFEVDGQAFASASRSGVLWP